MGSINDLVAKLENGTATSYDVADVLQDVATVLAGVGVLAGVANPWVLTAVGVAGLVNFVAQNHDKMIELAKDFLPSSATTSIMFIDPQDAIDAGLIDPRTLLPKAVSTNIGSTPDPLVKTVHYVDPLILDMDGDGLEITSLSSSPPVMFDADGDLVRTATAWAGPDDGLLVLDRNGNGFIDSGAELFGDETILTNGQKAAHGFAALSELDSNHDGQFNASDAQFSEVRIWRDIDQNGISDAGELQTLTASGVQAIKIASTTVSKSYGDAQLVQDGTFTRTDGGIGQVGSFILAQNSFVREFSPIETSDAARALPNLGGSGWVRDLQEAATLSPELIEAVQTAKDASTRTGFRDAVAALLREWGNDSSYNNASKQALAAGYGLVMSDPLDDQERGWMDKAVKAGEADREAFRATLSSGDRQKFDAMRERMVGELEEVYSYEAFTAYTFLDWGRIYGDATNYVPRYVTGGRVHIVVEVPLTQILYEQRNAVMSSQPGYIRVTIPQPPTGTPHVETLWNRLVDDATTNLMPTLRLSKYLDLVDLDATETAVAFSFERMNASIEAGIAANAFEGSALFLDLNKAYGSALEPLGWNGTEQLRSLMQRGLADANVRDAFGATGYSFLAAGATAGTSANDVYAGDSNANSINGAGGNDLLDGMAGNDSLGGGIGDDVMYGGDGADTLKGEDGNDTLDGGTGSDTLNGGYGSNVYLFGKGDGQDVINSFYDPAAGKLNTVQFKSGVLPSEVSAARSGADLVLTIVGTSDKLTVQGFFNSDNPAGAYNPVQQATFADGTTWDINALLGEVFEGTSGADNIAGTVNAETINGQAGDDTLYGRGGNDTLNGGADADVLYGEDGNDTLDGGTGSDTLNGGYGNNVYLFGKGDGQDVVNSFYDPTVGKLNTVQFKSGVLPSEVAVARSGSDLVLTIAGTSDKLTVQGFFNSDNPASAYNPVQQAQFADGTTWDVSTLLGKVFAGTSGADGIVGTINADTVNGQAGNDTLSGRGGNDTLNGGADADVLYGEDGNDTLDGGTGSDTLNGGYGNNVYLFGKGDGQDVVNSFYDPTVGKLNTVQFKSGVLPGEVAVARSGSDLVLTIASTSDKLTVQGFFNSDNPASAYNPVQQVTFNNGTTWDVSTLLGKVFAGTSGADNVIGTINADTVNGQAGNDTLSGRGGNDTLNGGADADVLYGEDGNDTLDGGTGSDTLNGGYGNNVYLFGKGDGQDVVNSFYDPTVGKLNTVQFKSGVLPSEVAVARSGSDLVLTIASTSDKLTVQGFFNSDNPASAYNPVQQVTFNNGTTWDVSALLNKVFAGTIGADNITGTINAETINGQAGDDTLYGRGGNDTLNGGADADVLYGEDGNDTLDGGTGSDTLNGGYGNNAYLFGKGDGQDVVNSFYDPTVGKLNTVQFKSGVLPSEVAVARSGSDLVLTIASTSDKLTVQGFFSGDNAASAYNPVQQVTFNNGTSWDVSTLLGKVFAGTSGADNITGTVNAEIINGQAGNDTLSGRGGNDTLNGGADADVLYGEDGNDTLDGGTGSDTLNGGYGNNAYLFGKGDGQDVVNSFYDPTVGKLNTVQFKSGVLPSEVAVARSGSDLVLTIASTSDKLTVQGFFNSDNPASAYNPVQQVTFNNGTTWDVSTLLGKVFAGTSGADNVIGTIGAETISGQAGNDTLSGRGGNDTLNGGADADVLYGEDGNDTLDGGTGSDTLNGGYGNNVYLFGKGDGQDVVNSFYDPTVGKLNTVQFKSGVLPSEVAVARSGSDLVLTIASTSDKLTVQGFFNSDNPASAYNPVQQVTFNNGTSWDVSTLLSKVFAGTIGADNITGTVNAETIAGQAGDDTLYGRGGNDTLNGGADADVLYGEDGNDTLDGGTGSDTLNGGYGNNAYLFGKGDGQDVVNSFYDPTVGKINTVQFKSGVLPSEVAVARSGSDLVLTIASTSDKLTVQGFFNSDNPASAYNPVQQVTFNNGTTWDVSALLSKVFAGTSGADSIVGTINADTVNGQAGNDTLSGRGGNDMLNGGADADVLYGEDGNDTLDGGTGSDTLNGGYGNNVYLFGKGDGQDVVNSFYDPTVGKLNTVQFKSGVLPSEVAVARSGSDLVLTIASTSDKLTVQGFFNSDNPASAYNPVQQAQFADGTTWDVSTLLGKVFAGTSGADSITGTINGETINGQAGTDTLYGRSGNDTLSGGADADLLYGEDGNDTFDGGTGSDTLVDSSTSSNDVYRWGIGYGADTIQDSGGTLDWVEVSAGIVKGQVKFARNGNHLEMTADGQADKLTVTNWYASPAAQVEEFRFSDGSKILASEIASLIGAMSGFAPPAAFAAPAFGHVQGGRPHHVLMVQAH